MSKKNRFKIPNQSQASMTKKKQPFTLFTSYQYPCVIWLQEKKERSTTYIERMKRRRRKKKNTVKAAASSAPSSHVCVILSSFEYKDARCGSVWERPLIQVSQGPLAPATLLLWVRGGRRVSCSSCVLISFLFSGLCGERVGIFGRKIWTCVMTICH